MATESTVPEVIIPQPTAKANGHSTLSLPHGNSSAAEVQLPKAVKPAGRSRRILIPIGAVLGFLGVVTATWLVFFQGPKTISGLKWAPVEYRDLQLKIVERGALEAKDNHDIKCEVKAGSRGAPKIKWVADNGAYVKKGDLLVDIDDSYLVEQKQAKLIDRKNAEALKIAAEQTYPVKKIAIALAIQMAEKWIKGDFPQQLHSLEGQIQNAESLVLQQEDRTAWVGRMVKKQYMTASQQEAEQATLISNRLSLQQLQEQKKVLIEYTDPVTRQTNDNAIKQARVDERTAYATMEMTRGIFEQQDDLYKDLEEQVKQCKIYAPGPGIVVYSVPEQTRMGSGSTQSIIAQGEPVQYGQKLMSIPDLAHMLVNVRIHEAFINHMSEGLPATIRVDAVPGKALKGHVRTIANVASPPDWMSPDVKIYQAYVEIDDPVEQLKLKPGLSAVCTIFTDSRADHALSVPIQAVLSPLEKNGKPRCFVKTPAGPEGRDVELGLSDKTYIEIKSGLSENDEVVLTPGAFVTEKDRKSSEEDEKALPGAGKPPESSDSGSHAVGSQGRIKSSGGSGGQPAYQK